MTTRQISAGKDHLARMIGKKPMAGVAELVWNALDADATRVSIQIDDNGLGAVAKVVISDNGHGFTPDEVEDLFGTVGESWKRAKADGKTRQGSRLLHGRRGEGRWQAFAVGDRVKWESVTSTTDGSGNQLVSVEMRADRPDEYEWTGPTTSVREAGTTATIYAGTREPNSLLVDGAPGSLLKILALYLTQYPGTIEIDYAGERLDPESVIATKETIAIDLPNPHGPITLTILEWMDPVDRALYLCDENGATLYESDVRIHAPGFDFTAYVQWAGFRLHEATLPLADLGNPDISPVVEAAREALRAHFKALREDRAKTIVEEWVEEDVYPWAEEPEDPVERAEQALFNYVAVTAAATVNTITDPKAKRLSLRTMRIAVEGDPSAITEIFREVLALPEDKIEEFRRLLQRTPLTALLGAMRTVTDRLDLLAGLEHLLFDAETAPEVLERAHLHKIIEDQSWLFGEEFAMHVSDKGLTALLQAHCQILGREALEGPVTDSDGKQRRIDFLFGRALEHTRNRREHLVVEIKRPSLEITRHEINQIQDYADAVINDSRFDVSSVDWDFVIIGTKYDATATSMIQQADRTEGLILTLAGGRVRIWGRKWADVIADAKHRLKFVRTQLEYDPDSDQALDYLRERYPEYLPPALRESSDSEREEPFVAGAADDSEAD